MNKNISESCTDINNIFQPQISVIIPIYNGEEDLPQLISCLLSQTYPKDSVEYLLVDNNSSDRSFKFIKTAADNSPINIRALQENNIQSSYAARNAGIRVAKGEILVFTDADCRPQPKWLETIVKPFVKSEVVMVAGEIIAYPGKSILERFADTQETLSQKHTLANSFCPYGQTANLAIRYISLIKAGLFRPYLTTGGDADMCWRIQQDNDGCIEFASDAIVKHRHRSTIKELASQWRRYGRSNRYLHELHGIELMKEMTTQELSHRLLRWILKEVPKNCGKALIGRASILDTINTPIGLFTAKERYKGQQEAQLPEKAKIVEWL